MDYILFVHKLLCLEFKTVCGNRKWIYFLKQRAVLVTIKSSNFECCRVIQKSSSVGGTYRQHYAPAAFHRNSLFSSFDPLPWLFA